MTQKRIVSLSPYATEIVCALGGQDLLVGVSHDCDYPASVAHIPSCTEAKVRVEDLDASNAKIAEALIRNSLSMYCVLPAQLNALSPDIVITQIPDDSSTIPSEQIELALHECCETTPTLITLSPQRLSDATADFERIAEALKASDLAEKQLHTIRKRMGAIARDAAAIMDKPTVACVEWTNPLMSASKWMPELITMAGGYNLFGESGQHSSWMSWDDLYAEDPDIIIVCPTGNDLATTRKEMEHLTREGDWFTLDAVKEKRTFLIDGNRFCHRPGPRLVETLEVLAEILHPNYFDFDHQDSAWTVY